MTNTAPLTVFQGAVTETQAGALPGHAGPSKKRRPRAKGLNWQGHRGVLKQLYMHEEKTLKDVMAIMETEHGFVARSVRQSSTCTSPSTTTMSNTTKRASL